MLHRMSHRCLLAFLMVVLSFSVVSAAWAEAVGGPASVLKKKQWVFGIGSAALLGRGLDGNSDLRLYQIGHYRGYGLTDRISLYGMLGAGGMSVEDKGISKTNSFGGNALATAQVKGRLWQSGKARWQLDSSLGYSYLHARHKTSSEGLWKEFQAAMTVARSFRHVKPYAGVKCSLGGLKYKIREGGQIVRQGRYQEAGHIGGLIGTDLVFGEDEQLVLNIEGAYLNGPEVDLAVGYTF